jgi:uncharacterized DUF497 family protein
MSAPCSSAVAFSAARAWPGYEALGKSTLSARFFRIGRGMDLSFEWDKEKAASNQKKHQVSFEEAATVFADPLAAIFDDEVHSDEEQREIIVGHSAKNRLLLVCFTERAGAIRIISARRATKKERRDYEEKPDR